MLLDVISLFWCIVQDILVLFLESTCFSIMHSSNCFSACVFLTIIMATTILRNETKQFWKVAHSWLSICIWIHDGIHWFKWIYSMKFCQCTISYKYLVPWLCTEITKWSKSLNVDLPNLLSIYCHKIVSINLIYWHWKVFLYIE